MTQSADNWATAILMLDRLRGNKNFSIQAPHPSGLLNQLTSHVFLCGPPTEYFSKRKPVFIAKTKEEEGLRPIDILYGRYCYQDHFIEIFHKNIERDAKEYCAEIDELINLVRIHEYAHAITHLGIHLSSENICLRSFGDNKRTDWPTFLENRNKWFGGLGKDLSEFLAQLMTYAAISMLPEPQKLKMIDIFERLEKNQPSFYHISDRVKKSIVVATDWRILLSAARGDLDVHQKQGFALKEGLESLICLFTAVRNKS